MDLATFPIAARVFGNSRWERCVFADHRHVWMASSSGCRSCVKKLHLCLIFSSLFFRAHVHLGAGSLAARGQEVDDHAALPDLLAEGQQGGGQQASGKSTWGVGATTLKQRNETEKFSVQLRVCWP